VEAEGVAWGTLIMLLQAMHFAVFPACSSFAEYFLPQTQANLIAIEQSPDSVSQVPAAARRCASKPILIVDGLSPIATAS
jgi:hypothetical protein